MLINILFTLFYFLVDLKGTNVLYLFIIQSSISLYLTYNRDRQYVSIFTITHLIGILIGMSNINLINVAGTVENTTFGYVIVPNIDLACKIFVIGFSFFYVGLDLSKEKSLPSIKYEISDRLNDRLFYYILILSNRFSLIFILSVLHMGFLGSLINIFIFSGLFGIIYYYRLWKETNNRNYRTYSLILYVELTVTAVMKSYLRGDIILPTVILFMAVVITDKNLKLLTSQRVIPFVFVFFLFSYIFSDLGSYRGQKSNFEIISNSILGSNTASYVNTVKYGETRKASILQRTSTLAPLTVIIKLVNDHDFYGGLASAPLLEALIPRFLYPDKATVRLGAWFAVEGGLAYKNDQGNINNSVNMTIPGELYLDFGWWGIVIGCTLVGFFYGVLWNSTEFHASASNLTGTIFGGYLMTAALQYGMGADLQLMLSLLSLYILFLIIKWIL